MMHFDTHNKVGTSIGGGIAMVQTLLSGSEIVGTITHSAIGALAGFVMIEGLKYLKRKLKK